MLISCKSNGSGIAPIMPSGKFQFETNSGETLYFNTLDRERRLESEQDFGFSPIMQKETFDKLNSKVESILGDEKLPDGQLTFLFSEPDGLVFKNPPVLQFSFVASESSIQRENVEVLLDNQDLSSLLIISKVSLSWRKADLFHAILKPDFILDPENEHQLSVRITPEDNKSLVHSTGFRVPMPQLPIIMSAGFRWDNRMSEPSMNELQVLLYVPDGINLEKRILNPLAWNITYENDTALPPIMSIQKHPSGVKNMFIIKHNSEALQKQKVRMIFSPFSGLNTRLFEFMSPVKPPDRGGDSNDRSASVFTCDDCSGRYSTTPPDGDVHSAVNDDDFHTWHIKAFCPANPPCLGVNIHIFDTVIDYIFDPDKYFQPGVLEDNGTATPDVPNFFYTESLCSDIDRFISYIYDFRARYKMRAYLGQNICDDLATDEEAVGSDTQVPSIDLVTFPEVDISEPGCSEVCCEQIQYHLFIDAHDDNCMNQYGTKLIIFYQDGRYRDLPLQIVDGEFLDNGKQIKQEFVLDTVNIFACATGLKVIVHDKKGNWKAKMVNPQQPGAMVRAEDRLPYPSAINLNYGNRHPVYGKKQYVNLDRAFVKDDSDICIYKFSQDSMINHGRFIYLELRTQPPVSGVGVQVEWLDPESEALSDNNSPTNKKGLVYSEDSNRDLSSTEHEILWSKHPAYGLDGRTLGDNRYYFGDASDCGDPAIAPSCDPNSDESWPIRSFTPDKHPCFLHNANPQDAVDPSGFEIPPLYYLDAYCYANGSITLHTNINGKAAVFFDACGFGGDNFNFKAFTENSMMDLSPCKSCNLDQTVTVWRKIYADYAWMSPRNTPYECRNVQRREHQGCQENPSDFRAVSSGVFDDCYIELGWYVDYPNTHYQAAIPNRTVDPSFPGKRDYPVLYVPNFDRAQNDKLLHIDIDHVWGPCVSDQMGFTNADDLVNIDPQDQRFFSYSPLGNIFDKMSNDEEWAYPIDQIEYRDTFLIDKHCIAHELTHNIYNYSVPPLDNRMPYGLMNYDDRRWYLHKEDIMLLRKKLPVYDQNQF
jgi:hypothetical protein